MPKPHRTLSSAATHAAALPGSFRALPAWTYRSAELMQLEYEHLILPSWQFACHISQVKCAGDYVTLDLMRDSIIIMRGKDDVVRAFKNVCRHRGARLLDGSGTCKGTIVCPYHGWSYGLAGNLRALPAAKTFPGIDLAQFSLSEVELEVFHGLVFVRLIAGGPSVAEIWGDLSRLLAPFRLEELELADHGIQTQVWNCNWKVAVDNNLENYHVPVGHPGYDRLLDLDPADLITEHGVYGTVATLKAAPSVNPTERYYQQLAPEVLTGLDSKTRRTWLFFTMPPNLGFDIYPDCIDLYQVLPRTAETCSVRWPIFKPKDERREAKAVRYLNLRINRQVGNEDKELCERVQSGLNSHRFVQGPLSLMEVALKDFHDRIAERIPFVRDPAPPADFAPRQAAE